MKAEKERRLKSSELIDSDPQKVKAEAERRLKSSELIDSNLYR